VTREIVETLVLVGLPVHKEPRAIKVIRVNKETLVQKVIQEIKVLRVFKELEVSKATKAIKVIRASVD
jgi:hypothetical protein